MRLIYFNTTTNQFLKEREQNNYVQFLDADNFLARLFRIAVVRKVRKTYLTNQFLHHSRRIDDHLREIQTSTIIKSSTIIRLGNNEAGMIAE